MNKGSVLVIVDGMTEEPAIRCKNMESLRQAYGWFQTCPPDRNAESMVCILTLLGVPGQSLPRLGRAYLEAVSRGIPVELDDLVFRLNLVTEQNGRLVSPCGGDLPPQSMEQLARLASQQLNNRDLVIYPMGGYKNLAVIKGQGAYAEMTAFPPHQHNGEPVESLLPAKDTPAGALCRSLSDQSAELFAQNGFPGCRLFPWGMARREELPTFQELHGCRGAAVCATEIVRGIALSLGLNTPEIPGATADIDTNLTAKLQAALTLGQQFPFVLVHVNGADEASHRKNREEKLQFLNRVDRELIAPLLAQDCRILLCSDHSTLSLTGEHRGDPQPFALRGAGLVGNLGTLPGTDAVSLLLGNGKGMI